MDASIAIENAVQRDMAHHHARSGEVGSRNDVLKSVMQDAQESLQVVRQSLQEIPFDQMAKDATEGIKSAAEGVSKFATETVADLKQSEVVKDVAEGIKSAAGGLSELAKEAVEDLKNFKIPFYSETQSVAASTDSDWEHVATQAAEEGSAVRVAVSEGAKKWADQLTAIRDILPHVETRCAIQRLEQANGNVEIAVNALMEES